MIGILFTPKGLYATAQGRASRTLGNFVQPLRGKALCVVRKPRVREARPWAVESNPFGVKTLGYNCFIAIRLAYNSRARFRSIHSAINIAITRANMSGWFQKGNGGQG